MHYCLRYIVLILNSQILFIDWKSITLIWIYLLFGSLVNSIQNYNSFCMLHPCGTAVCRNFYQICDLKKFQRFSSSHSTRKISVTKIDRRMLVFWPKIITLFSMNEVSHMVWKDLFGIWTENTLFFLPFHLKYLLFMMLCIRIISLLRTKKIDTERYVRWL